MNEGQFKAIVELLHRMVTTLERIEEQNKLEIVHMARLEMAINLMEADKRLAKSVTPESIAKASMEKRRKVRS